jgi:predicted RNA-binding protein associated with RNAse of E/G family
MELTLVDAMMRELMEAARDCQLTPRQFAIESLESVLASRRLPKVYVPALTQGPRMRGTSRGTVEDEPEFEDAAEAGLVTHRILL